MGFNQSTEGVNVEEHDNTYGVKKVSNFKSGPAGLIRDGSGLTFRQVSSGSYNYYGLSAPGTLTSVANWRVMRDDGSAILFADGNDNFDNIWDNYSSLTYA